MVSKKKKTIVPFRADEDSFVSSPSEVLPTEEAEKEKVPTVRHSGHYVDSKLKHNKPKTNTTLFNALDRTPCQDESTLEIKYVGIRLTPSQEKLISTLYNLLREKSENKDTKSEAFYKGNFNNNELVEYGDIKIPATFLEVSYHELYSSYFGTKDYSGKEINEIKSVVNSLQDTKQPVRYDRIRKVKNGKSFKELTDRIECASPLLQVMEYTQSLTNAEKKQLDEGSGGNAIREKKSKIILKLHPILTDQIDTKYVEYPQDINQRTAIASGGKQKVTEAINILRDYLMRELSAKRYKCEINSDKLPYQLHLDNYIRDNRKKKIRESINSAIQACKNLGILLEAREVTGADGQLKYVFEINKKFK